MDMDSMKYALAQSWETHRQAFGPILEPAFRDNPQVRIILVNALNHISRREIQRGMELLKELQPHCACDEDKAAWAFFVGLCFEMAGAGERALEWYEKAGKIGHRFYLPWLKLAKAAHGARQLEKARDRYAAAIGCLLEMPEEDRDEVILGSAYANLTSCLVTMGQYAQAEAAWNEARKFPLQPGAEATAAVLYAALGDRDRAGEYLRSLEQKQPALAEQVRQTVQQLLNGA